MNDIPLIRDLTARAVMVPFRHAPKTASGAFERAPLVLVDLATDAGLTGRCYLFAFTEPMLRPTVTAIDALAGLVRGQRAAPRALRALLQARLRLLDIHGILNQALAAVDMAAWDVAAQAAGMPLARMLGAGTTSVPAYNSCGLWIDTPLALADDAPQLADEGNYRAVKMRLGRETAGADLAAVRAVRRALADDCLLMCDFNQSLGVGEAIERARMIDDEGLYWIEEPVAHNDYAGCAAVAAAIRTPLQLGENLRDLAEFRAAIAAGAARYYMPDVQRIGGVTGWLDAAALAAAHGLPLSSHLFPEYSVHLLAASRTAHWLEYVDWASPVLESPLVIADGHARVPDCAGSGVRWDEDAVARYSAA